AIAGKGHTKTAAAFERARRVAGRLWISRDWAVNQTGISPRLWTGQRNFAFSGQWSFTGRCRSFHRRTSRHLPADFRLRTDLREKRVQGSRGAKNVSRGQSRTLSDHTHNLAAFVHGRRSDLARNGYGQFKDFLSLI